jgi:twinkle protein
MKQPLELFDTYQDAGFVEPRGSGWVNIRCPRCSDKRTTAAGRKQKCLSVHVEDQNWYCQHPHCGWNGAIRKQRWQDRVGIKTFARPEPVDDKSLPKWLVQWFAGRGIEKVVLERNGIYADTYSGQRAIAFPYLRDGEIVTVKYRYGEKEFRLTEKAELIPMGLDDVKGAERVYIVEGEADKLVIEQVTGCVAVLSPPNGSKPSEAVFAMLTEAVADARDVILAGDMDVPGLSFTETLAKRIGYDRCSKVIWPEKDANETLMAHGAEAVQMCLDAAKPYPVAGIISVDDLWDAFLDYYDKGMQPGRSTGWLEMDEYFTLGEGEFNVYTGVPGSGKTRWLDHLMHNLMESGERVGLCSMETRPLLRHMARLAQLYTGKPFGDGPTQKMTRSEAVECARILKDRVWWIAPDRPSVDSVLETMQVLIRRHGVTCVVIDPYNRLEATRPAHLNESEFAHMALDKIQRVTQNHLANTTLVAHPKKPNSLLNGNGQYRVVQPYDISGSAAFFNIADNILSIWRDKVRELDPVEVHVVKIRNEEVGKLGACKFSFNLVTGQYTPVANQKRKVVQFGNRPFPEDESEYVA